MGALLVYDITNTTSFKNLENWINEVQKHAEPNCVMVLAGNKKDLEHLRTVEGKTAQEFAHKMGMTFFETSALDSTNVKIAFQTLFEGKFLNLKLIM